MGVVAWDFRIGKIPCVLPPSLSLEERTGPTVKTIEGNSKASVVAAINAEYRVWQYHQFLSFGHKAQDNRKEGLLASYACPTGPGRRVPLPSLPRVWHP